MLILSLLACELFDPSKVGAYSCSEYCPQVIDKTDACAEAQYEAECAKLDSGCPEYSEDELQAYAAEGNGDWGTKSKEEMLSSCEADLAASEKSETQCNAETATINNLSCDEILGLIGGLGG